ncbi:hypothetical protein [Streptomyces sp. NPDC018347]|uniref:hypothetical protein n=1 Tax=Streptomyces sp. NPDC018347 TaxID=3157193 RepID=UPI0033C3CE1B
MDAIVEETFETGPAVPATPVIRVSRPSISGGVLPYGDLNACSTPGTFGGQWTLKVSFVYGLTKISPEKE